MKGAGARSRWIGPPQRSQVVSGASVMRCRTSKSRGHLGHSYSYVGTNPSSIMATMTVSRRRPIRHLLLLVLLLLTGCAASSKDQEVQQLKARSFYEQGLKSLADKQVSAGLNSLKEAVRLDPTNPVFRN